MARDRVGKKTIAFRPTEKSKEAIKKLLKLKQAKNKSEAVNQLIEKATEKTILEKAITKIEEKQTVSENDRDLMFFCPELSHHNTVYIVSARACQNCKSYPCEQWRDIKANERVEQTLNQLKKNHTYKGKTPTKTGGGFPHW